jgi:hypothetical protein
MTNVTLKGMLKTRERRRAGERGEIIEKDLEAES